MIILVLSIRSEDTIMAKLIDRILDSMKLNDSELEDDFDYDEMEEEEPAPAPKKRRAEREEEPEDYSDEKEKSSSLRGRRPSNVVSVRQPRTLEVCMIRPKSVEEGREICDTLLSGRAVVINLEGINMDVAQRIIDFTSGACYSMNGNLQKISSYIFIVTPQSVELSGDFQEILGGNLDTATLNINL